MNTNMARNSSQKCVFWAIQHPKLQHYCRLQNRYVIVTFPRDRNNNKNEQEKKRKKTSF